MKTREKWMVGLMILALIYGAHTLLTAGASSASSSDTKEQVLPEVIVFAQSMRNAAAEDRLTNQEEDCLRASLAPWPPTPFYDRIEEARPSSEAPARVHYTGFFEFGTNRMAIINNREYRLGEAIAGTDFHLEVIESDRVILSADEGRRRVPIALRELSHITRESL